MNTIYLKSTTNQVEFNFLPTTKINKLAVSYLNPNDVGYSNERLYKIQSTYSISYLTTYYNNYGTVINKIEAYLLGKQLQPDRVITLGLMPPTQSINYSFDNVLSLSLPDAKVIKKSEIDAKTEGKISNGFVYNSKTFSLSKNAQSNFTAHRIKADNGSLVAAGKNNIEVSTIDDEIYNLQTSKISEFTDQMYDTVSIHLSSGRQLKVLVNACTTIEEVNNILDNR